MDDAAFNIGRIVERTPGAPQPLKPMGSNSNSNKSAATASAFPRPMPDRRYTTRNTTNSAAAATSTSASTVIHTGNMGPPPSLVGPNGQVIMPDGVGSNKGEQPLVTSEFLQVLRQTAADSQKPQIKLDAGAKTALKVTLVDGQEQASQQQQEEQEQVPIDTILRVVRSSVPTQRAAAMTALKARSDAYVASLKIDRNNKRKKSHHYVNAPPDVIAALFHPDEAGPRLALLSHLAYEDPSHTVREAAFLCWLSLLNSCSDDTLDTLVLAAITGAPTDDGDDKDDDDGNEEARNEVEKKQDADELKRRRVKFDKTPPELDDVDVRCGPTGIRIERKYFTLEAVTKLLLHDPALGMARLGVFRTLLDRAVGRAADHDPEGSSLSTVVGGISLLDSIALWRCVASAAHESSTAAGYMCEHKSFGVAFEQLVQATIGISNGGREQEQGQQQEQQTAITKRGVELLPCVRDALIAIHSAVYSSHNRAHRLLPQLWLPSEGGAGLFMLMKFLELPFNKATAEQQSKQGQDDDEKEEHSAASHFPSSASAKYIAQCSALMCCILRTAVRFSVDLSEENDDDEQETGAEQQQQKQQDDDYDPIAPWLGDVLPFLATKADAGSFTVFEMLLINATQQQAAELKKQVLKKQQQQQQGDQQQEQQQQVAASHHLIKSDLKRIIDDLVFPVVETFLNVGGKQQEQQGESNATPAAATAAHLLATWIGEGSLVDVFYGDRDETALMSRLEPLLEGVMDTLALMCSGEFQHGFCIVHDALAHGLARIVDVVARCYPKVRPRVSYRLQDFFSRLLTATDSSPLMTHKQRPEEEDAMNGFVVPKEEELARVSPLAFVGELLRTAQWMSNNSGNGGSNNNNNSAATIVLRGEVVACIALALIRKALAANGGADSAVSAGLTLLLPIRDNEPEGTTLLRQQLAETLVLMISGAENAGDNDSNMNDASQSADQQQQQTTGPSLPHSLPVSPHTSDPLFAWLLSPCLVFRKESTDETLAIRSAWCRMMSSLFTMVSAVSGSLSLSASSSATSATLTADLLPHPLSVLAGVFLAAHCTESAYDTAPVLATEQQRQPFQQLATTMFALCCRQGDGAAPAFSSVVTMASLAAVRKRRAAINNSLSMSLRHDASNNGVPTLRRECLETIVRCASDAMGCLEMLFVFTTAVLLRGHPEHCATLLSQLWLKRAHWLAMFSSNDSDKMLLAPWITRGCLDALAQSSVREQIAAARFKFYSSPSATVAPRKIFTERDALEQSTTLLDELSTVVVSSARNNNNRQQQQQIEWLLFVKAALAVVAEMAVPCGEFVRSNVEDLIETRLGMNWPGAVEVVRNAFRQQDGRTLPASIWLNDILCL